MTRKRIQGLCKLCLNERLLCHSHIVPEFCYRFLYGEKHDAIQTNFGQSDYWKRVIKKGYREYLLCEECEGLINSRYEQPFHNTWYNLNVLQQPILTRGVHLSGLDYSSFKLFHLSILWRAAASDGFGSLELGTYFEKIRLMLLSGDAGRESELPIIGSLLLDDDKRVVHSLVTQPLRARLDVSYVYSMCYAGCEWAYLMTDWIKSPMQEAFAKGLRKDGRLTLITSGLFDSKAAGIILPMMRKRLKVPG